MPTEYEKTAEERIENALIAATETQKSPAMALYRIMSALGFDFGDPESIEHSMMQHYADPSINPFVQAHLDAKILIDVGEIERLNGLGKFSAKYLPLEFETEKLLAASRSLEEKVTRPAPDGEVLDNLVDLFIGTVQVGIHRLGVGDFNKALSIKLDTVQQEMFDHLDKK